DRPTHDDPRACGPHGRPEDRRRKPAHQGRHASDHRRESAHAGRTSRRHAVWWTRRTRRRAAVPATSGLLSVNDSAQTAAEVIRVEGVTKVYQMGRNAVHALRGITLSVRRGEMIAIMGHSGSG